ncbi:MAG: hypothetical protein ACTHZO_04540 [Moraxellaceae bacterium]
MKGYVSIDEMIKIAESKIKGSIFEILGTENFLQRALDNAEIEPVFYFSGYGVLQAFVENKFYRENENIQNMWRFDGYFRDRHSNMFHFPKISKERLKSSFRNLENDRFILRSSGGYIIDLNYFEYVGSHTKEALNDIDVKGEVTILNKGAALFNEKPVYKGHFGHEDLIETIIIKRDDVYIDIRELSKVLNLEPSAYDLTLNTPKAIEGIDRGHKVTQLNTPTDDEPTHHKSVGSMQALVTTLIKMAEYDKSDLADPYGELNKLIQAKAEGLGLSVKKDFIAKWLKKADDVL